MKILVVGASGLIGKKVVPRLRARGATVIEAAPSTGVNVVTGDGVSEAMVGIEVVLDVSNTRAYDKAGSVEFFERAGKHIFAAERQAGVKRHVALSVVGTDRLAESGSGYFYGKVAQETLVRESGVPYTIVRATQFFEFLGSMVPPAGSDEPLTLPAGLVQPITSDEVADAMVDAAFAEPENGVIEIAGPTAFSLADLVSRYLVATNDTRPVRADPEALYFGARLGPDSLLPGPDARLAPTTFESWIEQTPVDR